MLKDNPEWIVEAHKLGLEVNVWTVNDVDALQFFIDEGVDYITTNNPLKLQQLLEH